MRNVILTIIFCAVAFNAMAQKPHYLPGDGVYIVGQPADLTKPFDCPVMVAEAYQTTFKTTGAELASISAGKSYNISNRILSDGTLDLISFMGCGAASNLKVLNYDGESYTIGDYAPNKTWTKSYLVAAYAPWNGNDTYTLGVYDHWDCPVTYDADAMLTQKHADGISVDFGNPHEGLVCSGINFNLISESADLMNEAIALTVNLNVWDDNHSTIIGSVAHPVKKNNVRLVGKTQDGKNIYAVYINFITSFIIAQPFSIDVLGFSDMDVDAWIPRAVDTHSLYPTHTTYHLQTSDEKVAESDACINIEGYFNYVGTWGWPDGKCEYGECVAQGDYVQVYIDPSDPDWPGQFFTGDPTFPVECAYGIQDLALVEKPDWISEVQIDSSQWDEHGALLIIMQADALPSGETGRYDKVVISTLDGASQYTIHIRQGTGSFPTSIEGPQVSLPAAGGMFDLSGRRITDPQPGQIYIKDGKKILNK